LTIKYQPFYCEENIWQLCQHPKFLGGQVIFIAAVGDYFPMFFQKTGQGKDQLIFWDYHVVLLQAGDIHDFNSTLSFSTPLNHFLAYSFADESLLEAQMIPKFRVISAEDYVASFLSDRRHMKTQSGWSAPPPSWPVISESSSNLEQFSDMEDLTFGEVMSLSELLLKYTHR
jgi:hypothetical protein